MAEQNELADLGDYLASERSIGDSKSMDDYQAFRRRQDQIARRLSQSRDAGIQRIGIRLLIDKHSHMAKREIQRYLDIAAISC